MIYFTHLSPSRLSQCASSIGPAFARSVATASLAGKWRYPACFCRECARRVLPSRYTFLFAFAAACIAGGFALGVRLRDNPPERLTLIGSPATSPTPLVSAQDAKVETRLPAAVNQGFAICGARTKRGTPCRHRVLEGQRCAQHQGLPSMLDNSTKRTQN
jgi:hypothetical protein